MGCVRGCDRGTVLEGRQADATAGGHFCKENGGVGDRETFRCERELGKINYFDKENVVFDTLRCLKYQDSRVLEFMIIPRHRM